MALRPYIPKVIEKKERSHFEVLDENAYDIESEGERFA